MPLPAVSLTPLPTAMSLIMGPVGGLYVLFAVLVSGVELWPMCAISPMYPSSAARVVSISGSGSSAPASAPPALRSPLAALRFSHSWLGAPSRSLPPQNQGPAFPLTTSLPAGRLVGLAGAVPSEQVAAEGLPRWVADWMAGP
jgi:hypothetical protein